MSSQTKAADRFDLSRWRIAGNGADMIRPDVMQAFVDSFADAGFQASSFCRATALPRRRWPSRSCRRAKASGWSWSRKATVGRRHAGAGTPAPLPRHRQLRPRGRGHGDRSPWKRRQTFADRSIGKVWVRGTSVMEGYFRDPEATAACMIGGWLDTGDMGYLSNGYIFIVGRAKDMIIINGRNHWPQDIEWAVEQLPGFKSGDIAAFAITGPSGEETPAVLVHCRVSDPGERGKLRDDIRERVRAITGITPVVELVPPRILRNSRRAPRRATSI